MITITEKMDQSVKKIISLFTKYVNFVFLSVLQGDFQFFVSENVY